MGGNVSSVTACTRTMICSNVAVRGGGGGGGVVVEIVDSGGYITLADLPMFFTLFIPDSFLSSLPSSSSYPFSSFSFMTSTQGTM